MRSLGFDLLDHHVVRGRGDEVACSDEHDAVTFVHLLERSAALAGGLRVLGVVPGDQVVVEVGRPTTRATVVCACIRLGAVPGHDGPRRGDTVRDSSVHVRDGSDGPVVRVGDDEIGLDVVVKAGRADPASSLVEDPPGLAEAVRSGPFAELVESLLTPRD